MSGALNAAVHAQDLLKEVAITSTIVWSQVKQQEGNTTLSIKARPRFPYNQSLPSGSFHKSLILIPQRTDRMKTAVIEN